MIQNFIIIFLKAQTNSPKLVSKKITLFHMTCVLACDSSSTNTN